MITTSTKTTTTPQLNRVFKTGLIVRDQTTNQTGHVISGVAIPFNQPSLPIPSDDGAGFFIEQIDPHALDGVDLGHVYLLQNHDPHDVLARVDSGSLNLSITDDGLAFTATLADTSEVNDLLAKIKHGDVKGLSFGALVDPADVDVTTDEIGRELHIITRIDQLNEISITPIPAYTESQLKIIREQQLTGKESSKTNMTDTEKLKQGLEVAIKALNGALSAASANYSQSTKNGSESASDASKSTSVASATTKANRDNDDPDSDNSTDSAAADNNDGDTERDCNNTKRDTNESAGDSSDNQAKPAGNNNSAASASNTDATPASSSSSQSSSASSASTDTSAANSASSANSNSNSNSQEAKKDMTRELHSQNAQPALSKDEAIKRDFKQFLFTNKATGEVAIKRDADGGVQATNGTTSTGTQAIIPFDTLMPIKEQHQFTRLEDLVKFQQVHHPHGEWHSFKEADQVMKVHDELAETIPQAIPELRKVRYDLQSLTANYLISQEAIDDNDETLVSDMSTWLGDLKSNTNDELIMGQLTHNGVNTKKMSASIVDDIKHVLNVDLKPQDARQASIIMSQSAFNALDTLKDAEGRYLLNGDLSVATDKTLLGKPIVIVDDTLFPSAKAGDENAVVAPLNEAIICFIQNTIRAQYVNNWSAMDHVLSIYMRESIQLVRPDLVTVITGSTATANAAKKPTA